MLKIFAATALLVLAFSAAPARAESSVSFGSGENQFNIDFVTIGNPGNAADTTGAPDLAGSVGYVYQIGKYEVSRDMVTKANKEGGLGITLHDLDFVTGGPRPNMPATGVSWNEAARFVNWLNTSQGFHPAYKFALEPGDEGYSANADILLWQASDVGYNVTNRFRNALAVYFLPSVDEWYKAAYYDPIANGGTGAYWNFPTGSDDPPTIVSGGTAAGTAVWGIDGPADITNAGGLSPLGVMGLGGNAYEWEETEWDLVNDNSQPFRGARGGSWNTRALGLSAMCRSTDDPTDVGCDFAPDEQTGFRVAMVPEPSTGLLWIMSILAFLHRTRRKRV